MSKLYNSKRCIYKGFKLASTYELRAAYILDKEVENGIIKSWEYPKYKFIKYKNKNNITRKYVLDFICIDNNDNEFIIEVKGRQIENDLYKWKAAKEQGYNLIIWKLKDIKEKEKQYNISNIEINDLILKCIDQQNIELKKYLVKRQELENYRESKPKCLYCGKIFIPRQLDQKFCNKKHNYLYAERNFKNKNNETTCPYCNKIFIREYGGQKYCCEEHRNLYYQNIIEENQKAICPYCNKQFKKNKNIQKYCCEEHRNLYYKQLKLNNLPKCFFCEKEFIRNNSKQKYCCREHKNLHYKQLMEEKNSHHCLFCNKEINRKGKKFCNREHLDLYYRNKRDEK